MSSTARRAPLALIRLADWDIRPSKATSFIVCEFVGVVGRSLSLRAQLTVLPRLRRLLSHVKITDSPTCRQADESRS